MNSHMMTMMMMMYLG